MHVVVVDQSSNRSSFRFPALYVTFFVIFKLNSDLRTMSDLLVEAKLLWCIEEYIFHM